VSLASMRASSALVDISRFMAPWSVGRRPGVDEQIDGSAGHVGADYQYDGAGRLVWVNMPDRDFGYRFTETPGCGFTGAGRNSDRVRLDNTIAGSLHSATYCYDQADRLSSVGGDSVNDTPTTVSYDARGNVTQIYGETLVYDQADRLVRMSV